MAAAAAQNTTPALGMPLPPPRPAGLPGATDTAAAPPVPVPTPAAAAPSAGLGLLAPATTLGQGIQSFLGPTAAGLGAQAHTNFDQGNYAAAAGNVVGSGVVGAAHVLAAPFVGIDMAGHAIARGVNDFAAGLFGARPPSAAPLPAQVATPPAAPAIPAAPSAPTLTTAAAAAPAPAVSPFGVSYNPAAGPTPSQAASIVAAQNQQLQSLHLAAPAPVAAAPAAGMPVHGFVPGNFPAELAASLPRGGAARLAAIQAYQQSQAQALTEGVRGSVVGEIQKSVADAMKPVEGDVPATAAARLSAARNQALVREMLLVNPQAAMTGNMLGALPVLGQ